MKDARKCPNPDAQIKFFVQSILFHKPEHIKTPSGLILQRVFEVDVCCFLGRLVNQKLTPEENRQQLIHDRY